MAWNHPKAEALAFEQHFVPGYQRSFLVREAEVHPIRPVRSRNGARVQRLLGRGRHRRWRSA